MLNNKRSMKVLITGGSRGIGAAIVSTFRNQNHDVYAPDRKTLDLSSKKITLERRDFDIVVNNAGINPLKNILDINDTEVLQVNYLSPLSIVQQCIPYMLEQKYGRIINIGSIWIDLAKSQRLAYSSSKTAIHALTKSISAEYSSYNILANTVSPGFINTELTRENNTSLQIDKIKSQIPLKRLGTPQEIADIVYFFSIVNTFITGQNIIADGGFSSCVI